MEEGSICIDLLGATPTELRSAIALHADDMLRAIEGIERQDRRFAVDVTVTGAGIGKTPSLMQVCDVLLDFFAGHEIPSRLPPPAEISIARHWTNSQTELRLLFHHLIAPPPVPAGILLVDIVEPTKKVRRNSDQIATNIRRTLESHMLVGSDSEYAVAIDVAEKSGSDRVGARAHATALMRSVTAALRSRQSGEPKIVQFRVRLTNDVDEDVVQLRIWRLGFMKVPSQTRIV